MKPKPTPGFRATALPVLLLGALLVGAPAVSQMPADSVLRDFLPSGDFVLELDGKDLEHAEIYLSETAIAYLLMAPELESPVMISPRRQAVETVNLMKVVKRESGSVDLLADAVLAPKGNYELRGQAVVFDLDGKVAKLKPRPPLVGEHQRETLLANPDYQRRASDYHPTESYLETLRGVTKDVRVRIYFGSWCPVCKKKVPKVLKIQEALADSKIRFEFYGLPQPMTDDPVTQRENLHGVPTAIVYVEEREVGRLTGNNLDSPEASLSRMLGSS